MWLHIVASNDYPCLVDHKFMVSGQCQSYGVLRLLAESSNTFLYIPED